MSKTNYRFGTFGIVLENYDKGVLSTLHRTEVTDTAKYDKLILKIDAIREEAQDFLNDQEKAGKIRIFLLGGNSEGEFYPEIVL